MFPRRNDASRPRSPTWTHNSLPLQTSNQQLMSARTLLAFKAGRAQRREGTNFVDPEPTKGAIYIQVEDELLHFVWKNRSNGEVEEVGVFFSCKVEE